MADESRILLEDDSGVVLNEDGSAFLLQGSAETIYWHNLRGDNNARDRRNYTTDLAGTVPAIDAPVPLRVNALAWYDAKDESTITEDVSGVTAWADKSGNGHTLTPANGGTVFANPAVTQPTYERGEGVVFDGVADRLGANTRFGLGANPDLQVIMVVDRISEAGGGNDNRVWELGTSGAADGFLAGGITNPSWGWRYNGGNELYDATQEAVDGETNIAVWRRPTGGDYAAASFFLNGTELSADSSTNPTETPDDTGAEFRIGRGQSNGGSTDLPANVRIREMVILESATDADRQLVEAYLAEKWGLNSKLDAGNPDKEQPQAMVPKYGTGRYWRLRSRSATEGGDFLLRYLEFWRHGNRISPKDMTSDSSAGFVSSASSANSPAWRAFDGDDTGTFWRTNVNAADEWIQLDFGADVEVDEVRISQSTLDNQTIRYDIEFSADGVNWTPTGTVGMISTFSNIHEAYATDVKETDDLRFDGSGAGGDDDWSLATEDELFCNSIDFQGSFYTGTVTVGENAGIEVTGTIRDLRGGTFTAWEGDLRCQNILDMNKEIGNSGNPLRLVLRDLNSVGCELSWPTSIGGSNKTWHFDTIRCLHPLTLNQPNQPGNFDRRQTLNGQITGNQPVIKTGGGQLALTGSGDIASVDIQAGTLFVSQSAAAATQLQGLNGTDAASCTITITGADCTLRYGCGNNGSVEWGNPLVVDAGATNARLHFQGTGNSAQQDIFFPVTMNADLWLTRGSNVNAVVEVWSAARFTALSGAGTLTPMRGCSLARDGSPSNAPVVPLAALSWLGRWVMGRQPQPPLTPVARRFSHRPRATAPRLASSTERTAARPWPSAAAPSRSIRTVTSRTGSAAVTPAP